MGRQASRRQRVDEARGWAAEQAPPYRSRAPAPGPAPNAPVRRKALGAGGGEVGIGAHGALQEGLEAGDDAPQGVAVALRVQHAHGAAFLGEAAPHHRGVGDLRSCRQKG